MSVPVCVYIIYRQYVTTLDSDASHIPKSCLHPFICDVLVVDKWANTSLSALQAN